MSFKFTVAGAVADLHRLPYYRTLMCAPEQCYDNIINFFLQLCR